MQFYTATYDTATKFERSFSESVNVKFSVKINLHTFQKANLKWILYLVAYAFLEIYVKLCYQSATKLDSVRPSSSISYYAFSYDSAL